MKKHGFKMCRYNKSFTMREMLEKTERCCICELDCPNAKNMIVQVPTEVIPVWFIEKWKKENTESGSALDHFIEQLMKDWHYEEKRQASN